MEVDLRRSNKLRVSQSHCPTGTHHRAACSLPIMQHKLLFVDGDDADTLSGGYFLCCIVVIFKFYKFSF